MSNGYTSDTSSFSAFSPILRSSKALHKLSEANMPSQNNANFNDTPSQVLKTEQVKKNFQSGDTCDLHHLSVEEQFQLFLHSPTPSASSDMVKRCFNKRFQLPENDTLDSKVQVSGAMNNQTDDGKVGDGEMPRKASQDPFSSSINAEDNIQNTTTLPSETYQYTREELKEIEPRASCLSYSSMAINSKDGISVYGSLPNDFEKKKNNKNACNSIRQEYVNLQQSLKEQSDIANKSAESEVQQKNNQIKELSEQVEQLKVESSNLKENEAALKLNITVLEKQNSDLTNEVSSYTEQNLSLKSSLQESKSTISSNKEYIDLMRKDRDNFSAQVVKSNQDIANHQLALKQLQQRCVDAHNKNSTLEKNREEMKKDLLDKESHINQMKVLLASRDAEKTNLDQLVKKLNNDIEQVQAEFAKIKRELVVKTELATKEESKVATLMKDKKQLTKKFHLAKAEVTKYDDVIRSQNKQIEELQSKVKKLSQKQECTNKNNKPNDNREKMQNTSNKPSTEIPSASAIVDPQLASLQTTVDEKTALVKSLQERISCVTEDAAKLQENEHKLVSKIKCLESELSSIRHNNNHNNDDPDDAKEKLKQELINIKKDYDQLNGEKTLLDEKLKLLNVLLLEKEKRNEDTERQLADLKLSFQTENERNTQLLEARTQDLASLHESSKKDERSREDLENEITLLNHRLSELDLVKNQLENRADHSDIELIQLKEVLVKQNLYVLLLQEDYQEWAHKTALHLNQSYHISATDTNTTATQSAHIEHLPRVAEIVRSSLKSEKEESTQSEFRANFNKLHATLLSSIELINRLQTTTSGASGSKISPSSTTTTSSTSVDSNQSNHRDVAQLLAKLKAYKQTVKVLRKRNEDDMTKLKRQSTTTTDVDVQTDPISSNDEVDVVKSKMNELVESHHKKMDELRKKKMMDKAKQTKKLKEAQDKFDSVSKTNEKLQKAVENLQVKESQSKKRLEQLEKERNRYRNKSRSLRTCIRSMTSLSKLDEVITRSNENKKSDERTSQLDASVNEITMILGSIKDDMHNLERRVTTTNSRSSILNNNSSGGHGDITMTNGGGGVGINDSNHVIQNGDSGVE